MHRILNNPLAMEMAAYALVVFVAAGLALTHWAAPFQAGLTQLASIGQ